MFAEVFQPALLILFVLVALIKPKKPSPKKVKVQIKTELEVLVEKERRRRVKTRGISKKISFKRYKDRRMTPLQWLRLKFEFKQGLLPSRCVPLPLNWRKAIHESMWWLPLIEKDGWWLEASEFKQVGRALKYDYTNRFYATIRDYATGGHVGRHEGGNLVIVIEGLQRTGKSDLAKTVAKHWQMTQWDVHGRSMIVRDDEGNPERAENGKVIRGVKPKIYVVLSMRELNKAIAEMSSMDILIADELDKWTGLGSKNRAEGYVNLIHRIAKTGKSFIFVSPEVRIPAIKQLAYLVLATYGISYAYEATRFIVSKKSRYTQQYKLLGLAAMQRNWRFAEFKEYHEKKDKAIESSQKRLGLETGFDRVQVEKDRKSIWSLVYNDPNLYKGDEEVFFAYALSMSDWRDLAMDFKDEEGEPLFDVEGLGGDYAKYVCQGLASRHKRERINWRIAKKEGKRLGTYAQEIDVAVLPKSIEHVQVSEGKSVAIADISNLQIDFRPMLNVKLEHNYIEAMYDHRAQAIQEKWGQDTIWGKKIEGAQMTQLQRDMNDALLSWRLMAMGYSTRKTARELSKEGFNRSHVTALNQFNKVQENIAGIMDELAFAQTHPHLTREGGETVKGLPDFVYKKDGDGEVLAIISKKERNDKYWRPVLADLSEQEQQAVLGGRPVFLVVTELDTGRMQYWIAKTITPKDHVETIEEWKQLGKTIFVDMLGLDIELET